MIVYRLFSEEEEKNTKSKIVGEGIGTLGVGAAAGYGGLKLGQGIGEKVATKAGKKEYREFLRQHEAVKKSATSKADRLKSKYDKNIFKKIKRLTGGRDDAAAVDAVKKNFLKSMENKKAERLGKIRDKIAKSKSRGGKIGAGILGATTIGTALVSSRKNNKENEV